MTKSRRTKLTLKVTQQSQSEYPHRLAKTSRERRRNLDLLFTLQQIAYPQLRRNIRMRRDIVRKTKLK